MAKEFTGVWVPIEIYQDKNLNPTDKFILADILTLTEYYKSNDTIAIEVGVSKRTATRSIKKLEELGYIKTYFNGRSRIAKMTTPIAKMAKLPSQNGEAASPNRPHSIQKSIQKSKHIRIERPFNSKEFDEIWDIWIDERKQQKRKKYTERGEKATLHNLQKISNNNEKQAIKIIQQSITQGWAGLFAVKGGAKRNEINAEQALEWASGE